MDKQLFVVSLKDIFSLVTLLLQSKCSLYCVCSFFLIVFKTAGGCVVGIHSMQVSTAFSS